MGLFEIIGATGSLASIEAEIRAAIDNHSKEQAECELANLCATEDFSHLPSELADCMDKVESYLDRSKSELLGSHLFSQEEKNAVVSNFFESHIDLRPYWERIEPIILKYVNQLEILLLQQMSQSEKVIYGMERRNGEKLDAVSTKLDMIFYSKVSCHETSGTQIQDIIEQAKAELPEDYIERKVIPHRVAMMDRIERLLNPEEPISLKKAIMEHKRILLLSDAGHGKSTELKYAVCVMNEASLFPFFYSLYHYCREPIESILPTCYSGIEYSRLALIFDGFDEMLEPERCEFLRRLTSFLKTYSETRVMISSRSNFCKVEVENQSQTFKDFYVYDLDDLAPSDIEKYISIRGIDINNFISESHRVKIEDLLCNPFYLTNLVQLYREKNYLPHKSVVMEHLVQQSFALDDEKFQDNLEEHCRHLFAVLEQIAFAMQLMHKQNLDDSNEYQELFTEEERSLVKHSGLFRKDGGQWRFIHSNFKEYLAAKYLSTLTKEAIINYLSDGCGIRNSWINTLSYLVNMELVWDIQSWLLEFSPNALVKFESGSLSDDTRASILKTQFIKFEKDMLWISDSLFSVEQLASFGCCEDSLDFLLDKIKNPVNQISQISAVELLRYFPRLFGRKRAITEALLACCVVHAKGHESLCYHALYTMSRQNLVTPEIAAELVTRYQDCSNTYIRWGMYRLLVQSGQHNVYFQFFLDGIDYIGENNRMSDETIALADGLKAMSDPRSVRQAIICIAQMRTQRLYSADEIYEALCESAVRLYFEGHNEFYQILLECYFSSAKQASRRKENTSLRFFEMTGTIETAVIDICNYSKDHIYLYALFDKQDNLELVKQAYINEKLKDHKVFHSITAQFADDKRYIEYSELICQIDGISMPERRPRVNYEKLRIKGQQEFFDALFNKDKVKQLVLSLIQETRLVDPKIGELENAHIKCEHGSPLLTLKFALQNFFCSNEKVSNVVGSANWNQFILFEAERIIEQEKSVVILPEQEEYLIQLVHMQYKGGLVERAIRLNQEHPNSLNYLDRAVFLLTVHFNFVPDEPDLLQMIELPSFAFMKDDSEKKYEYLEEHLTSEIILFRVADNIVARKVYDLVLLDHIEYCTKLHYEDVRDYVIEAANDPEGNIFVKTAAIKYLYHIFGEQCVRRNVLPYADKEVLLTIARLCPKIPSEELRTAMERQFKKETSIELMAHLLRLGSDIALCEYIRQAEAKMALPEGRDIFSEGPTAAIAALHNPGILPMLEKLLNIALSLDFQDGKYWSLYSSLSKALVECGREDPNTVLAFLQQHKKDSEENEHAFRFFSYTLDELQRKLCAQQDFPWMLQDVKRVLANT